MFFPSNCNLDGNNGRCQRTQSQIVSRNVGNSTSGDVKLDSEKQYKMSKQLMKAVNVNVGNNGKVGRMRDVSLTVEKMGDVSLTIEKKMGDVSLDVGNHGRCQLECGKQCKMSA